MDPVGKRGGGRRGRRVGSEAAIRILASFHSLSLSLSLSLSRTDIGEKGIAASGERREVGGRRVDIRQKNYLADANKRRA